MRKLRLTKKDFLESIMNTLKRIDNDLMDLKYSLDKQNNELYIIEKNTEGLNYILLENQKKDGDSENSRG